MFPFPAQDSRLMHALKFSRAVESRRPVLAVTFIVSLLLAALLQQRRQLLLRLHFTDLVGAQHLSDGIPIPFLQALAELDTNCATASRANGSGSSDTVSGEGRASSAGCSHTSTSAAPTCSLDVEPSEFADSCELLRDACVDQGTVILYRKEDVQELQADGQPGYRIIQPPANFALFNFIHLDGTPDHRYTAPPIRIRPASAHEGAPYLQEPAFSSCTVPIVWFPFQRPSNFAHLFRDNAAKLLGALQNKPWRRHAKLVLMTAEGLLPPEWNFDTLQPLFQLKVETWADFSARVPAWQGSDGSSYVPASWQFAEELAAAAEGKAPLSSEGGPQRCFRQMFVCSRGINVTAWPLHGLGQHLMQRYHSLLGTPDPSASVRAAERQRRSATPAEGPIDVAGGSSEDGDSGSEAKRDGSSSGGPERMLRVLFQKRDGPDRQLLNAAELVEQCNSWRYTTKAGQQVRGSCAEVGTGSLLTNMAAAQQADVFVGVHGANVANAWFMRPGSSMIELQPFGFDAGPAHLQYPLFNAMDNESAILWWLVSVCDPGASTPGTAEQEGLSGDEVVLAKNRNLRIGWPALRLVLETAVEVGGNMTQYRQRWEEGTWWWWMARGGSMEPVGPGKLTKQRCPTQRGKGRGRE